MTKAGPPPESVRAAEEQAAVGLGSEALGSDLVDPRIGLRDADPGGVHDGVGQVSEPFSIQVPFEPGGRVGDQGDRGDFAYLPEQSNDILVDDWKELGPGGDSGSCMI